MTYVVYLKFTNSDKKKILIDTGGAEIIEVFFCLTTI